MIEPGSITEAGIFASTNTSGNISVDVGSGDNRGLIVAIMDRAGTINVGGGNDPTSVTYNGDALALAKKQSRASGEYIHTWIYYISNPDAGTNNLVVTFGENHQQFYVYALPVTGMAQTSALDQTNGAEGVSGTVSASVTPTEDDEIVVAVFGSESSLNLTQASGIIADNNDHGAYVSGFGYVIQGTAAAQAMTWTGTSDDYAIAVASFKKAATSGPSTSIKEVVNVAQASLKKISGIVIASVGKISGVANA